MVDFVQLDPFVLDAAVIKYLRAAVNYSPFNCLTIENYVEEAKINKKMIIGVYIADKITGAFVMHTNEGDQRKILMLSLLGGKQVKLWRDDLVEFILQMGKDNACTDFSMVGRKGWGKLFPELTLDGFIYSRKLI